jgi:hypothetical protein
MAFLNRLMRRAPAQPSQAPEGEAPPEGAPQPQSAARRPPTPGQVRRERRALVRAREERIRDLGGLMLEMYKRDRLRPELFFEQCAEVVSIEERIQELDGALAALTRRTLAEANRCACGAPLVWGAHFCANCGRPAGGEPVVACAHCGNPLPAEASFCANCGRPAEPAETGSYEAGAQDPTVAGGLRAPTGES